MKLGASKPCQESGRTVVLRDFNWTLATSAVNTLPLQPSARGYAHTGPLLP